MSFHVLRCQLEFDLPVPRARAWVALTRELPTWWGAEHTAAGGRMDLDARPGGQLVEHTDDGGGVLWATVALVVPQDTLELFGELSPAYGGPARTSHRFRLEDREDGASRLRFQDCVWGAVSPGAESTFEAGWRAILGGLVAHLS